MNEYPQHTSLTDPGDDGWGWWDKRQVAWSEREEETFEQLQALADALEPLPAWLMEESGQLSAEAIEVRLAWLRRQARAGHEYALAGVLGPSTVVWVRSGQILVREYVGVNVYEV